MQISVVNLDPAISTTEMLRVIQAVNDQIERDVERDRHMGARLRLDSHDPEDASGRHGDAILYVMSKPDEGLAEYHEQRHTGVPFGYVLTSSSDELAEPWSSALRQEVLELLACSHASAEEARRPSVAKAKIVHRSVRRADRREPDKVTSTVPRQTGRKQVARKRRV